MDISRRGLDFIKRKEGYYSKAYKCPAGVWTIGWGSVRWDSKRPVREGDTCTEEQAEKLLLKEVQRVEDAIDSSTRVPLTQGQFDAICSLGYNIGTGWITGSGHKQATFMKLLNRGRYESVPSEFLKFSNTIHGTRIDGLYKRRKEEIRELWLCDYGFDEHDFAKADDTDPERDPMPQAVAPSAGSMTQAAKESWTIRGAAAAVVGTLVQIWDWLFGAAKEASAEIVAIKDASGPFEALFTAAKANMVGIAAGIVLIGCAIVIVRRLTAAKEGRTG